MARVGPIVGMVMVCAALLIGGCARLSQAWKTPEIDLLAVQPKQIGFKKQSFIVTLRVKNPNDRTLPLKAMTYRLQLEGDELADGGVELDRQIPALGEEVVDIEVNTGLLDLMSRLPSLALKRDDLEWKITGTVSVADGWVKLPYRYRGEIDPEKLIPGSLPY